MTFRPTLALAALALSGCTSIPIDVGTKDPVKVDIAMKVDVYQHADPNGPKKTAPQPAPTDVAKSRRNRMGEIQVLKNSRLVGESHAGALEIRTLPPGEYGDYVKTTVDAENSDRGRLIEKLAKEKTSPFRKPNGSRRSCFRKGRLSASGWKSRTPRGSTRGSRRSEAAKSRRSRR